MLIIVINTNKLMLMKKSLVWLISCQSILIYCSICFNEKCNINRINNRLLLENVFFFSTFVSDKTKLGSLQHNSGRSKSHLQSVPLLKLTKNRLELLSKRPDIIWFDDSVFRIPLCFGGKLSDKQHSIQHFQSSFTKLFLRKSLP